MEFGEKLQTLRKERNLSQEKLAEIIHVSRQTISKWENEKTIPDTENIVQLSDFFHVPIQFFLDDNFKMKEEDLLCKKDAVSYKRYIIFCMIGVVINIAALCSTKLFQYFEMITKGSCYTNILNYLWEFPLYFIVFIGSLFMIVGVLGAIKMNFDSVYSSQK